MPEPPAIYADMIRQEVDASRILASHSRLGRTLRRQKELLEKSKVFGEFRLRQGMVTPELLNELRITGYDLVVSGFSPATDRFRRYMLGEITREIVNSAELPVLVIRTGSRKITGRFGDLVAHLFRRSRKT
jgi:nucleotide-binding universal stress UspA family protein